MQAKLLNILLNADEFISGQVLSEEFGISRQAVWKTINLLKERGCEIKSVQNKGYKLISIPDHLDDCIINELKQTGVIGSEVIVLDRVASTNDYLKRLGDEGAVNGTLVATREQFSGKGRLGRVWESERDENIAFSILLRPNIRPNDITSITPLTGLAVCKALRQFTGLDCKIKWPNDIVVGNKKLVGILTELSAELNAISYVVIGVGINVDQVIFPREISKKATSIYRETRTYFNKNELIVAVINQIEKEFVDSNFELKGTALKEYSDLCISIGKEVGFTRDDKSMTGTATAISENGELLVTLEDGSVCNVYSGEVTVQGIY